MQRIYVEMLGGVAAYTYSNTLHRSLSDPHSKGKVMNNGILEFGQTVSDAGDRVFDDDSVGLWVDVNNPQSADLGHLAPKFLHLKILKKLLQH